MRGTSGARLEAASKGDDADLPSEPPGRLLHRTWVDDLTRTANDIDLSDRRNFHHMMWLIMALGGNQTAYAERHGYQPTTVSRWVNGAVAPPKLRRRPIILDALEHLEINLKEGLAVPLKDFADEDTQGAAKMHAGRPVRRPYPVS